MVREAGVARRAAKAVMPPMHGALPACAADAESVRNEFLVRRPWTGSTFAIGLSKRILAGVPFLDAVAGLPKYAVIAPPALGELERR
jgi:hypothetical protein